ncbi:MAG: FHA domain-containing protein [Anaerolineae bacterium]|nr:FHA domain-containing protein [Anaerolineae bacterium]
MSQQPLQLTIQTGSQTGQTFQLRRGSQTIGRASTNQIVIPDPTVSKQHAQITVQPEGVWIQDLGSSNGTFVNGQQITASTWLKPGDTLQVGTAVVLGVQAGGGAMPAPAGSNPTGWLAGGLVAVVALLVLAGLGFAAWFAFGSSGDSSTQPPVVSETVPVVLTTEPPVESPTPAPEVVVNFTASKTTVQLGECVTLRWQVTEAREVRLDGELVPASGDRKVCPQDASKTYRLTALSFSGETSEEALTFTVLPTPLPPPGVEIEFEAEQTSVSYGNCTTLRWTVQNAQAVRLNGEKVGSQGTQEVCPTEPATVYQLLVDPLEGELVEQTVIINVPATPMPTATPTAAPTATLLPAPPQPQVQTPVIDKLIADQITLNQGGCTTLRWTVRNAQSVQLSGGEIGSQSVSNQGARRVCPPGANTTYTLFASGSGGSVQTSITLAVFAPTSTPVIVVVPQPQPPPAPAGPPKYDIGASVGYIDGNKRCFTLQGYIENVREAYLDGGEFNHTPLTGPSWAKKVCHKQTTTYVMTVILPNGSIDSVSATREGP